MMLEERIKKNADEYFLKIRVMYFFNKKLIFYLRKLNLKFFFKYIKKSAAYKKEIGFMYIF